MTTMTRDWSDDVFREMKARDIKTVCTIPDGGLTGLLKMVEADKDMRLVTLSTEEEGIGVVTGLWLGGTARDDRHAVVGRRQLHQCARHCRRPCARPA